MKEYEYPNIDELLNSFIDDELPARQRTEVQRLITHDSRAAQRLRQLQSCKMLLGSLPRTQAPSDMAEQVKASLQIRAPLVQQPSTFKIRQGTRHLLVRKLAATAAMIALIAALAVTVYTIVAPDGSVEEPVAIEDWGQPARQAPPPLTSADQKSAGRADLSAAGFNGRLELRTAALTAVDAFINRAIEDNPLLDCKAPQRQGTRSVYALSCSREGLNLLLADLGNIWERFDSATLFVETDQPGRQVAVDRVILEQILEIVNQDNLETRIELARDFAVLNNTDRPALADRKGDLTTIPRPIPKPVLTSSEKTIKHPPASLKDKTEELTLTVVVVSSE